MKTVVSSPIDVLDLNARALIAFGVMVIALLLAFTFFFR